MSPADITAEAIGDVVEILGRRGMSREERARAILEYALSELYVAYPRKTHAGVETVEAFGLTIRVDANGYAAEVHFPNGADY